MLYDVIKYCFKQYSNAYASEKLINTNKEKKMVFLYCYERGDRLKKHRLFFFNLFATYNKRDSLHCHNYPALHNTHKHRDTSIEHFFSSQISSSSFTFHFKTPGRI